MMSWIRCIREIFSGEIRDFRPSGAGGLSAVFLCLEIFLLVTPTEADG